MRYLDLTLDNAEANVALDEALLESCEAGEFDDEILRVWEPYQNLVVVGRSSQIEREVHNDYCVANRIPVIRRCSGGAAIVTGPGCLMYAVLLDGQRRSELSMLDAAHRLVLTRMVEAITSVGLPVEFCGTSDLALAGRKVSGNSLRRKRRWLLYHGTLLVGLPGEMIERCLNEAPRQPEYRRGRAHREFVGVLDTTSRELKDALRRTWEAHEPLGHWPQIRLQQLLKSRYRCPAWNYSR